MLIDLHSGMASHWAAPPGACCCQRGRPPRWIDDSHSVMKLYSSSLSRAALARWSVTIHPLPGTHLFLVLLRVLTSHWLSQKPADVRLGERGQRGRGADGGGWTPGRNPTCFLLLFYLAWALIAPSDSAGFIGMTGKALVCTYTPAFKSLWCFWKKS